MSKEDDKLFSEMDATITKYKQSKEEKEQKKKEKERYITVNKEDLKGLLDQVNKGRPVEAALPQQSIQPQEATQPQQVMQPQQSLITVGAGQANEPSIVITQQPVQKQLTVKQQIAMQIWKDSKATSIVCLIAMVLPMISILVAMFPDGAMYALVIALFGILYPCFVFVRMISIQTRLHMKYGLKPMFQFPQQNIPQQRMQYNKERML